MLSYGDKTFCMANCINDKCRIRLTKEIEAGAKSFGVLLSVADFQKGCYDYAAPIQQNIFYQKGD